MRVEGVSPTTPPGGGDPTSIYLIAQDAFQITQAILENRQGVDFKALAMDMLARSSLLPATTQVAVREFIATAAYLKTAMPSEEAHQTAMTEYMGAFNNLMGKAPGLMEVMNVVNTVRLIANANGDPIATPVLQDRLRGEIQTLLQTTQGLYPEAQAAVKMFTMEASVLGNDPSKMNPTNNNLFISQAGQVLGSFGIPDPDIFFS